jgi:SSS family solute:Na+ symporter
MILYPIVVSFLFLFPVLIGVWAHGAGIAQENTDSVLPMMVQTYAAPIYSFVIIGALAALMSTADSQLLSLSTMLSHDLPFKKKSLSEIGIGKLFVLILTIFAIIFVVLGYDPSTGIMGILVKTTFPGLAVLCPTTIAVLYWKDVTKYGCIFSIVIGELSIFLFEFGYVPSFDFLPAVFSVLIATLVLIIVSIFTNKNFLKFKNKKIKF